MRQLASFFSFIMIYFSFTIATSDSSLGTISVPVSLRWFSQPNRPKTEISWTWSPIRNQPNCTHQKAKTNIFELQFANSNVILKKKKKKSSTSSIFLRLSPSYPLALYCSPPAVIFMCLVAHCKSHKRHIHLHLLLQHNVWRGGVRCVRAAGG